MSNNFLALVVQARMNSVRFPNKMLCNFSGSPLIERILQRVKNVKKKQFYYQHQKKFTMINLINSYFFILRW